MNRFEKWSVWTTSALTVVTGLGYFVTKYLFTSSDPYAVVNHPWQPYFLKAHVLVSPLLLFALGTIAVHHVWEHWVDGVRLSRRSAMMTALAIVPMVATGYLIQVLTDQGWVRSMAIAHIVFGVLYGVGLAVHTWIVRRRGGAGAAGGGERAARDGGRSTEASTGTRGGPPPGPGGDAAGSVGPGATGGRGRGDERSGGSDGTGRPISRVGARGG